MAHHAATHVLPGNPPTSYGHKDTSREGSDVSILPVVFAHGDLPAALGAMAPFSHPIMRRSGKFRRIAAAGLGIGNGFSGAASRRGLLPWRECWETLAENNRLRSTCTCASSRPTNTVQSQGTQPGQSLRFPSRTLRRQLLRAPEDMLETDRSQPPGESLRYCCPKVILGDEWKPNGSLSGIAALCNERAATWGWHECRILKRARPKRRWEALIGSSFLNRFVSCLWRQAAALDRGRFWRPTAFPRHDWFVSTGIAPRINESTRRCFDPSRIQARTSTNGCHLSRARSRTWTRASALFSVMWSEHCQLQGLRAGGPSCERFAPLKDRRLI